MRGTRSRAVIVVILFNIYTRFLVPCEIHDTDINYFPNEQPQIKKSKQTLITVSFSSF